MTFAFNTYRELNDKSKIVAEKDATDEFEFIGPSNSAKNMMSNYYVGDIDRPAVPVKHVQNPTQLQNQSSGVAMKIFQFLVPLLILGLALGLRYYGRKGLVQVFHYEI